MFGIGKSKSVVGLDIGSSAVKAVELKASGKGFRVAAYGAEPVPADAIVDGAIIDAGAVAEAIRHVFEHNKAFKAKDVCASLSGNAVIVACGRSALTCRTDGSSHSGRADSVT